MIAVPALIGYAAPGDPPSPQRKKHRRGPTPVPTPSALPSNIEIPQYSSGPMPFHDGETLVYQAAWLGIPVANAKFKLHKSPRDPNAWVAEMWLDTNRFADLFYPMRDYMKERFEVDTLLTHDNYFRQDEKNRVNEFDTSFDRAKGIVTMRKQSRKGIEKRDYLSTNPWGPMSGATMALSQKLDPGRHLTFDVFTSNNRYVFRFDVDKAERLRVPFGSFDAIRLTPEIVYMSNEKLRSESSGATLWVSADLRRLPLRIEAAAFIGTVRADLIQVDGKPAGSE